MEMPDHVLARLWDDMDWKAAEGKLAKLQAQLTLAAFRQDNKEIQNHCRQLKAGRTF